MPAAPSALNTRKPGLYHHSFLMLKLVLALAAGAQAFTIVNRFNSVPTGSYITENSLAACQKNCAADAECEQFTFNGDSGHCYTSASTTFTGVASDHCTSGCKGCKKAMPLPPTPPAPTVTHGWVASLHNTSTPLANITYSHMATIVALLPPKSRQASRHAREEAAPPLAVAYQCTASIEGSDDQHIRFAKSLDGGLSWTDSAKVIAGDPSGKSPAVWGPVLFWEEAGQRLFLFYSLSPVGAHHSVGGELHQLVSHDQGETWGPPTVILAQSEHNKLSKVTANTVAVVGGTWLLPFWYEGSSPTGGASVLASSDGGASWAPKGFIHGSRSKANDTKVIENTVALTPSGGVLQLYRAGVGSLFSSVSDGASGESWSESAAPTKIPNPNSKVQVFARPDTGALILSYNPSTKFRSPLALAESVTGKVGDFKHLATLEDNDKKSFAYPTSCMVGRKIYSVYSVYDPQSTAPHTHYWWGIRIAITTLVPAE
jgi:predicted neuraminidase